jgi:hypothetical protein
MPLTESMELQHDILTWNSNRFTARAGEAQSKAGRRAGLKAPGRHGLRVWPERIQRGRGTCSRAGAGQDGDGETADMADSGIKPDVPHALATETVLLLAKTLEIPSWLQSS